MCFDKTGTLTEENLEFYGITAVHSNSGIFLILFGS
jgi:magnesium-transporting ATPase (P-type)